MRLPTFVLILLAAGNALSQAAIPLLRGNFWPNASFEAGVDMDTREGTPAGWSRGGSSPSYLIVSPVASSGTHSLGVSDDGSQFGEWYADVSLSGRVAPGDQLLVRWGEVFAISGGDMRVTLTLLSASGGAVAVKHFVVNGQSEGFTGDLATSPFSERNETMDVLEGAATLRVALVSGGSLDTTGEMVIDDLSVSRAPAPILLAGNLWTNNPTFEAGTNLDARTGVLDHWTRAGSLTTINQVITNNFVSPGHALAVIDTAARYGEWSSDLSLSNIVRTGDTLNLQWFEFYNVADGEMRLSVSFLNASGGAVDGKHFVAQGRSAGFTALNTSPFVKRNESLIVPEGAATFRVSLVSGGSEATTGTMVIDDFSMNKASPPAPDLLPGNIWPNPTFELGTDLDGTNAEMAGWFRILRVAQGGVIVEGNETALVSRQNSVSPTHSLMLQGAPMGEAWLSWVAGIDLGSATAPGKLLDAQWFELFNVTAGEMQVIFTFYSHAGTEAIAVGNNRFVVTGPSAGWKGAIAGSTFTRRNEQLLVPEGARFLRISMDAQNAQTSGTMLMDNLTLAPQTTPPVALLNNLLPNAGFEQGVQMENPTNAVPTGWQRTGDAPEFAQVLTSAYVSSTHSLAILDTRAGLFGQWSQQAQLAGELVPGDIVEIQWSELYDINAGGGIALTVHFTEQPSSPALGAKSFVATGTSTGWNGDVQRSLFTQRREQVTVPAGAQFIHITFTSRTDNGSTIGTMVIDDLSAAKLRPPADILAGNVWPNPMFEEGVQLDKPSIAAPAGGWSRGGTHIPGNQLTMTNATSPTHALALFDDKTDAYSEWYVEKPLEGLIAPGQTLRVQWFELYDTVGDMRLSFYFRNAENTTVDQRHFVVSGQSAGWLGDLASSPFVKRSEELIVPELATRMMVTFASGGSSSVTGTMIIDDLSMAGPRTDFKITSILPQASGFQITWESEPGKVYAIQSSPTLSPAQFTNVAGSDSIAASPEQTTSSVVATPASARTMFYRVQIVP